MPVPPGLAAVDGVPLLRLVVDGVEPPVWEESACATPDPAASARTHTQGQRACAHPGRDLVLGAAAVPGDTSFVGTVRYSVAAHGTHLVPPTLSHFLSRLANIIGRIVKY